MEIYNGDHKKIIQFPFPEEEYFAYLEKLGVNKVTDLKKPSQIENFFLLICNDFLLGKLDADKFCDIANELYGRPYILHMENPELYDAVYEAAELSYDMRQPVNIPNITAYQPYQKEEEIV